jgi:hypothetical protein
MARSPGACHPSVADGRCLAGVGFTGGGAAGPAERRRPRHRVEDRDEMCGAINTHRGCCEDDESWARLHLGSHCWSALRGITGQPVVGVVFEGPKRAT